MAKRFESLDGMRGLCALIVATHHFDTALRSGHLLNHGWLSVDVFFILSGFVIALTYEDRFKSGLTFGDFMSRRALRLIPTEWLGTIITALSVLAIYLQGNMARAEGGFSLYAFAVATLFGLLLLPISWSPVGKVFANLNDPFPINPPSWSLQGEWFINVLYSQFLYAVGNAVLFSIIAASATFLALQLAGPTGWDGILTGLVRATAGFLIGVLIYRGHRKAWFQRLPRLNPVLIYATWFFVCCVPRTGSVEAFQFVAALILAPVSIALLVRGKRHVGPFWAWAAKLSYPLYASHFATVNLAILMLPGNQRQSPLWALPMLLAALAVAAGIHWLVRLCWSLQPYGSKPTRQPAPQSFSLD